MSDGGDIRPNPDPTRLTTEQSDRLREEVRREAEHLRELFSEQLKSIYSQLHERAERRQYEINTAKEAVANALAAQKELSNALARANELAIEKSDKGTTKEIEALKAMLAQTTTTTNDRLAVINSRIDRSEGGSATLVAVGAAALSLMAVLIAAYSAFHSPAAAVPYALAPTVAAPR